MIDLEVKIRLTNPSELVMVELLLEKLGVKEVIVNTNRIKNKHTKKIVNEWADIKNVLIEYKELTIGELYKKLVCPHSYKTLQRRIKLLEESQMITADHKKGLGGNRKIIRLTLKGESQ